LSYSTIIYDQHWNLDSSTNSFSTKPSIDSTSELQVCDGAFQSIGTTTNLCGYRDYSSYYNNTLNYSNITATSNSNYRFSTFVWNIPNTVSTTSSNMTFKLKNFKINGNAIPGLNFSDPATGGYKYYGSDKRILIYYRIEDSTSTVPVNNDTNYSSTVWVDGNASSASGTSGFISGNYTPSRSTYFDPSYNSIVYYSTVQNYTYGTDLTVQLSNIIYSTNNNSFIYFIVGVPITSNNYSFTNVTLGFY
jgi:hypothetical protein